jgi:hypothetical protein
MTAYVPPFREPLENDNNIRKNSTLADYQKLRPAFDRKHGTVTAANSTPLTDGAAAVIMMTESQAKALGLTPLGYLRSYAFTAIDVRQDMLLGPAWSTPLALERAGLSLADLTLIDMHEALPRRRWRIFSAWPATALPARCLDARRRPGKSTKVNSMSSVVQLLTGILLLPPARG